MFPCHQAAWLIKPGQVLHKQLQPLSVGHVFLLEALESPFVVGGKIGLNELVAGVFVCALPFSQACDLLLSSPATLHKMASRWGFWCRLRGAKLEREISKFRDYMEAYMEMPELWQEKGKTGKPSAMPFAIRLAWCLMTKMSEADAWACPMPRALAYYEAEAEKNGAEFVTEQQEKIIEADHGES